MSTVKSPSSLTTAITASSEAPTNRIEPEWVAPGPGAWVLDKSHGPGNPTPFFRRIASELTGQAYRVALSEFGAAVDTIDIGFAHGNMYRRIVPLVGAKFDTGKVPPKPALWLATRLHPEFRRREKRSAEYLLKKPYVAEIKRWATTERFEWEGKNRAFQQVEPKDLTNSELAAHITDLGAHMDAGWIRHHHLHAYDLGPIGDLLCHAQQWGMDGVEVMGLLRGSSPATVAAQENAAQIADALRSGGVDPATVTSLDEIRSVPAADAALDDYLDIFGWRLIVGYDLEDQTLHELPGAVCAIVRAAAADTARHGADNAGPSAEEEGALELAKLRAAASDPELFDELVADARAAYGLRDDNGPLTWAWPAGLMRRSYLAASERLHETGRIGEPQHVFELDSPELAAVLDGAASPSALEIQKRAAHREWEATVEGPLYFGAPPDANPDLSGLPPSLRRGMGIVVAATSLLEPDPELPGTALTGLGIGNESYQGIARVADDPNRAIDELEPGDILVASYTAPSFNAVLSIAGGVVVQEGGLLSHAAVMARELDIAAVIGCTDAMTAIKSGDLIEIDPAAGTVTVILD